MDRSRDWEADRSSMGKAVAAAVTGLPSDWLIEHKGKCEKRLSSHNNVVQPRGQRGGLPVIEGVVVQGGCGVSGASTAEQNEECAMAGIAALSDVGFGPLTAPVHVEGLPSAVSVDNSSRDAATLLKSRAMVSSAKRRF